MMPSPVYVAVVGLIGWPLLKIATTLISRPLWKRLRAVRSDLDADQRYNDADRRVIADEVKDAHGNVLFLTVPFFAFFGAIAFCFALFAMKGRPREIMARELGKANREIADMTARAYEGSHPDLLRKDPRFDKLNDLCMSLMLLRYPVCGIFCCVALVLNAPLFTAVMLFKRATFSASAAFRASEDVILRSIRASQMFGQA